MDGQVSACLLVPLLVVYYLSETVYLFISRRPLLCQMFISERFFVGFCFFIFKLVTEGCRKAFAGVVRDSGVEK